ncbi:MAG: tRNA (adenosine(37)-N6)-threonylcarbamoyltransferase complex dimerization subunit type 1 TsaB [Bdellovibrionales bacterium]
MTLLAVDTSGPQGSLALAEVSASGVSAPLQVTWHKLAMHSDVATLELQNLMQRAGKAFSALGTLTVNIGPGSFTGLRVGLNLTRTLAYALDLRITPFNSLELLARKYSRPGERVLVGVKAIQSYTYAATYEHHADGLHELMGPCCLEAQSLEREAKKCTKLVLEGQTEARDLIFAFASGPDIRPDFSWNDVKPLYIRASEPEEKLKKGLIQPL